MSTTAFLRAANPYHGGCSTLGLLPGNPQTPAMPVYWNDFGTVSRSTGKERDSETGLDFFGARYFSGAQGRFTSADEPLGDQYPSDPQSWNLYGYVRNNPLKSVDPSGLDCVTTSDQSASSVTVNVQRGGSANSCGGSYVDGTVDVSSLTYKGSTLTWSDSSTWGGGAMTFASSPAPGGDQLSADAASTLYQAGMMADNGVKAGAAQMAMNGMGIVAGRLIGAAAEAWLASRAAGTAAVDVANLSNKIVRQMASRGWTTEEIVETVQNGRAYGVVNKATGGAATEYVNAATGKFVVVDNATNQVIQVSRSGMLPNHLLP